MPTHEGFGPDDEEPAIAICEVNATAHLSPQYSQLMPERGILRLKPDL